MPLTRTRYETPTVNQWLDFDDRVDAHLKSSGSSDPAALAKFVESDATGKGLVMDADAYVKERFSHVRIAPMAKIMGDMYPEFAEPSQEIQDSFAKSVRYFIAFKLAKDFNDVYDWLTLTSDYRKETGTTADIWTSAGHDAKFASWVSQRMIDGAAERLKVISPLYVLIKKIKAQSDDTEHMSLLDLYARCFHADAYDTPRVTRLAALKTKMTPEEFQFMLGARQRNTVRLEYLSTTEELLNSVVSPEGQVSLKHSVEEAYKEAVGKVERYKEVRKVLGAAGQGH